MCCSAAFAQPSKGDFVIGGTAGYNSVWQDDASSLNLANISPGFGYFVSDRFSIGLELGYQDVWYRNDSFKLGGAIYSVGANFKYYFPITDRLLFGLGLGLGYANFSLYEKYDGDGDNDCMNFFYTGLTPSLDYFISRRWIVSLSMGGLQYRTGGPEDDDNLNMFGLNWDTPQIGVSLKF